MNHNIADPVLKQSKSKITNLTSLDNQHESSDLPKVPENAPWNAMEEKLRAFAAKEDSKVTLKSVTTPAGPTPAASKKKQPPVAAPVTATPDQPETPLKEMEPSITKEKIVLSENSKKNDP